MEGELSFSLLCRLITGRAYCYGLSICYLYTFIGTDLMVFLESGRGIMSTSLLSRLTEVGYLDALVGWRVSVIRYLGVNISGGFYSNRGIGGSLKLGKSRVESMFCEGKICIEVESEWILGEGVFRLNSRFVEKGEDRFGDWSVWEGGIVRCDWSVGWWVSFYR